MKQHDRAQVDIQVEPEPQPQQDVAGVLVLRYPRIADGAEQDGLHVVLQVFEGVVGEGLAGGEVVVGAVGQALDIEGEAEALARGGEHRERRA